MKCTIVSAILFIVLSLIYGSAFAAVSQGLKSYSAGLFQFFRMFSAAIFSCIVLVIRIIFQKDYLKKVKENFHSGIMPLFHLSFAGILNLGLPHSLIAVAQKWISSSSVQVAQPIATVSGAFFSLCVLPDEPFDKRKGFSVGAALLGVAISMIAPMMNPPSGSTTGNMIVGFILLLIAVSLFGIAAVYLKWKSSSFDITVSAVVQMTASTVFCLLWTLIYDRPSNIVYMCQHAQKGAIGWPILVGCIAGGVAIHGFMYLVGTIGAEGANLTTIGQLIVGVILGIFLGEWKSFKWWEILLNVVGILFLAASIGIGIYKPKAAGAGYSLESKENYTLESKENYTLESKIGLEGESNGQVVLNQHLNP